MNNKGYLFTVLGFLSVTAYLLSATTKELITPNLPSIMPNLNYTPKYSPLISLGEKKNGKVRRYCSGVVISANYAITAAHCVVDRSGLKSDSIYIGSAEGEDTDVRAKAVAAYERLDYALLLGDFKDFGSAPVAPRLPTLSLNLGSIYQVCGFPMAARKGACLPTKTMGSLYFQVRAIGQVFPGMSGGPAVNVETGEVEGLIVAQEQDQMVLTPLIGLFDIFDISY